MIIDLKSGRLKGPSSSLANRLEPSPSLLPTLPYLYLARTAARMMKRVITFTDDLNFEAQQESSVSFSSTWSFCWDMWGIMEYKRERLMDWAWLPADHRAFAGPALQKMGGAWQADQSLLDRDSFSPEMCRELFKKLPRKASAFSPSSRSPA
jgi:hypothetical protein